MDVTKLVARKQELQDYLRSVISSALDGFSSGTGVYAKSVTIRMVDRRAAGMPVFDAPGELKVHEVIVELNL